MNTQTNIQISLADFEINEIEDVSYISWDEIRDVLGKVRYNHFLTFIDGQTTIDQGVYVCDVMNYLRKEKDRFFD